MMRLSRKLQLVLAGAVAALFCIVIGVVWFATTMRALSNGRELADNRVKELGHSVRALSDRHMLNTAHLVANAVGRADRATNEKLYELLSLFDVSEIHVIGEDGIIHFSTVPTDLNWNMADGEQSAEFLQLLHGVKEFAQPLRPKSNGGTPIRYVGVCFPEGGGFLQAALDEESFRNNLHAHAEDISELLRVRAKGFVLLADDDLTILSAPADSGIAVGDSLAAAIGLTTEELIEKGEEELFRTVTPKGPVYGYLTTTTGGIKILVVQPEDELFSQRNSLIPILAAAALPLFLAFFFLVNWSVQHFFTDDVVRIDAALGRISAGGLDEVVDVRSCVEFSSLSDNINAAAAALRHHAEAERIRLQQERDAAIAAEKERNYFFASVSHDIRTPLNSIIGFTQLLRIGAKDEATRHKYLDSIVASGEMLMQLINDVLDLSRLEAGKMVFAAEWCNVGALVSDTLAAFELRARENGLSLSAEIPADLPHIRTDPHRLRQILFNLLGNAVKYTHEGGVRVAVNWIPGENAHGELEIAVRDTGIGISREDMVRLGRPFEQLSVQNGQNGTGLGLAICKQMLNRMGGELRIKSELGHGSAFTIVLHGVEGRKVAPEPAEPTKAPLPESEFGNVRMLLVDDMELNLIVLASLCRHLGLKDIDTAESGAAALDMLRKQRYDLVLTDLWMPEMDGEQFTAAIRADPALRDTPVCAVTADVEARKTYRDHGFDGILLKPVQLDALRDLIQAHAGR